jgi:hypothetical protein
MGGGGSMGGGSKSGGSMGGGSMGGGSMGGGSMGGGSMGGGSMGGSKGAGSMGGGSMGGGSTGGGSMGGGGSKGGPSPKLTRGSINFQQRGQPRSIGSLYSLINATVNIPGQNGGQAQQYPSPLSDPSQLKQQLPVLLDETTTTQDTELPARINVNTAQQPVLLALEALGLQDADVQNILTNQPPTSGAIDPIYQTPAWLMTQANLTAQQMQSLERYVTARSQVYRVQSVGFIEGGGPTVRLEAVIDTNGGQPRISYWRDLTELGRGFDFSSQAQQQSQ